MLTVISIMSETNYSYLYEIQQANYTYTHITEDMLHYYIPSNIQAYNSILGYIFSTGTLAVNIAIVVLCTGVQLRTCKSDVFYLQVINFSVCNILIGAFVIPLTTYSALFPWNIGGTLCKLWIICDVLLPCISILILLVLTIDRLVLMTNAKLHLCLFQTCLKQILLMTPWLIAFVVVVPCWTHGALPYELRPGECVLVTSHGVALACTLLTFFVPLFCILLLLIKIILLSFRKQQESISTIEESIPLSMSRTPSDSVDTREKTQRKLSDTTPVEPVCKHTVVTVCLADVVYCSMWFPYHTVGLILTLCTSHVCIPSATLIESVTWTATASAAVVPYVWLVDPNIGHCRGKRLTGNFNIEEEVVG